MQQVLLIEQSHDHVLGSAKNLIDWNLLDLNVHVASFSFLEFLHLVDERQYSLLIINLKGFPSNILEWLHKIKQISSIPIILMEGKQDLPMIKKIIRNQVNDYLPSPVKPIELLESILKVKKTMNRSTVRRYNLLDSGPKKSKQNSATPPIIEKIKEYIHAKLDQKITLKQISTVLHYNSAYLGQIFKQHENVSFNEYLLIIRMERAEYLLTHTDLKIYEIAREIGYEEMDWFYKKFKEFTGYSANEYRKKYRYLIETAQ